MRSASVGDPWRKIICQPVERNTASGTIQDRNQKDQHAFDGRQGQLLELRVKRTSGVGLQPRVQLVDPSGVVEDYTTFANGPQASLEKRLASSGSYTAVVSTADGPVRTS
jgi:hypothetical protein